MIDGSFKYHTQKIEETPQARNLKMVQVLEGKECVGSFLFFLYGKEGDQAPGFITPPGLTDYEAEEMCKEFFVLFGRYAKLVMDRKK